MGQCTIPTPTYLHNKPKLAPGTFYFIREGDRNGTLKQASRVQRRAEDL